MTQPLDELYDESLVTEDGLVVDLLAPDGAAPVYLPQENGSAPVANWSSPGSAARLHEFSTWTANLLADTVNGRAQREQWHDLIRRGWHQGVLHAFDAVIGRRPRLSPEEDIAHQGARQQFVRDVQAVQVNRDRVELIAARTLDEVEAVARDVANRMAHAVSDGMVSLSSSGEMGRAAVLASQVGVARLQKVASFQLVRSHAEGQLDGFQHLGVDVVTGVVEVSDISTGKACPECSKLGRQSFSIDGARGVIPLHPGCQCAWAPVGVRDGR